MRYSERDSAKDQAVVLIFIIATVGLLVYAALRPYIEQWREVLIARPYSSKSLTLSAESQ